MSAPRIPLILRIAFAAAMGALAAVVTEGAARKPPPPGDADAPSPGAPRTLKSTGLEIFHRISADNISLIAAGVAFYAFLALFPAAAALVAVYGLVADPRVVENEISDLSGLLPPSAIGLILGVVKSVAEKPPSQLGLTFAVSVVITLWSARAGVISLMSGLDVAFRVPRQRSFFRQTLVALALTLGGILVAVALVATIAGLPALYAAAPAILERAVGPIAAWVRWPAVALVMALSLAVLYRFGPARALHRWRLVSPGAAVATVLWLASSCAFSLYVTWSGSYDATYGSLAGVVVMMLWLWASSLSVLVGATVDAVVEKL